MIYLSLATISFFLPWVRNNYGIAPFICLLLALPVGNAMSLYFYQNGLFFFDFYFLSLFVRLFFSKRIIGRWGFLGIALVMVYAIVAALDDNPLNLYFLRDFRLILYLITLISLVSIQSQNLFLSGYKIKWLAILSGCACVFYANLAASGFFIFEDEYYTRNAFRYFAVSSYFCFGFLAFNTFLPSKDRQGLLYYAALIICGFGIVLTGFRVMVFVALMLFLISSLKSKQGVAISLIFLFAGAPILSIIQDSEGTNEALKRVSEFSIDTALFQIHNRFLPFFIEFAKFDYTALVFGGGFGLTFEIPWFFHRESKDDINNFVDSTYLTLYAKFGISSVIYLIACANIYSQILNPKNNRISFLVVLALLLLWLVYSLPYQMSSIGLALLLFAIGAAKPALTTER